jgi:hypothetical protein
MAGYSGTPLAQKFGIKPGSTVLLAGAPPGFDDVLAPLPDATTIRRRIGGSAATGGIDVAVAFFTERATLERRIGGLEQAIFPDGGLWIAWPKRSSGVSTDITEDTIRDVALPRGLVDNKVCAVDDVWSGLRLVWRKENRKR